MPIMTVHVATIGAPGAGGALDAGAKYFFLQAKGSYEGLATETGIDEASEDQQDAPLYTVGELLGSGIVSRLTLSVKDGTKLKSAQILCTRDKVGTALDALRKKSHRGKEIKDVRFRRRRSFV